jgi:uncharacterized protein (TIGR03067 family)
MSQAAVVFSLCLLALGDETPADKDAKALQGVWQIETIAFKGKAHPEKVSPESQFVFSGDKLTQKGGSKKEPTFTFKLAPEKRPKEIDLSHPELTEAMQGIYELDGNRLKIAYSIPPGAKRPTAFASKPGSMVFYFTLGRPK